MYSDLIADTSSTIGLQGHIYFREGCNVCIEVQSHIKSRYSSLITVCKSTSCTLGVFIH